MSQPRRFKSAHGPERLLVALGSEEVPNADVKQRVARRLGISAAAIASAAATTANAAGASAAAAASSAKAMGSMAAGFTSTTGAFVTATFVKATVISLVLGVASYSGVRLYTSRSSGGVPSVTSVKSAILSPAQPNATPISVPAIAPAETQPLPETSGTRANAISPTNIGAATTAEELPPSDSFEQGALPVARFADVEPSASTTTSAPTATGAVARPGTLQSAGLTSPTAALPIDPRLAREVASLDRARASAGRGDSTGALRELSGFERSFGYVSLRKEAMLVHIDVLLSLGRRAEAAAIARQLLAVGAPANQRVRLEQLARAYP